jgi:hypothetical protein
MFLDSFKVDIILDSIWYLFLYKMFSPQSCRERRGIIFSFAAETPANENHLKLRFIWFEAPMGWFTKHSQALD